MNSASTNIGTDWGAIPANVSVSERATVAAGLANAVEDVNRIAAAMSAPTANGTAADRPDRTIPKTTKTSPNVATTSDIQSSQPGCACPDIDGSEAEHEIDNEGSEDRPTKLSQCVNAGLGTR
jgi:hypothetical protein